MREIFARSRVGAATFVSDVPWAAIQISAKHGDWPTLSAANRVATLQMCFPDRVLPDHEYPLGTLFSEIHADQILDFVLAHAEQIDWLLVHCEAGANRSPAVAAALTRIFRCGEHLRFFERRKAPNTLVYELLLARAAQRGLCP